jgi:hypothetical protein
MTQRLRAPAKWTGLVIARARNVRVQNHVEYPSLCVIGMTCAPAK